MGSRIVDKLALQWNRRLVSRFTGDDPPSDTPVAVLTPLAPKDIERARISIPRVRAMLAHPIERHVIVAPDNAEIRALCAELDVDYVAEDGPLAAILPPLTLGRLTGWLKQQFLKLCAPEIAGAERVVAFDSDTFPQRRTAFMDRDGRAIIHLGDRNAIPYHRLTDALIGPAPLGGSSFIAHCMLVEAPRLAGLRRCLEQRAGVSWAVAIAGRLDDPAIEPEWLSEYDLYNRYVLREHADAARLRYYAGVKVSEAQFRGDAPTPRWKRRFRFLSNHERATG